MIFYFYEAYLKSSSEMTIRGRPRTSNIPHVTETGGEIYDRTVATDISIITMKPEIPVATKSDTTYTNISTTRVTR